MSKFFSSMGVAACLFVFAITASAQTINVGTNASVDASYGPTIQTAGPFPWSDFGIDASAGVSPNVLNAAVGGSTSFAMNSTISGGESFVPGSTVLNIGYTPGWNGSINSSATGSLNSNFVYNIGPFNGSQNILNVPLSTSVSGNLTSSLQSGGSFATSNSTSGPGASEGFTLSAQACFIGCVTVASASVSFNVGTQIGQSLSTTSNITYGDLVWESTTPTYSGSDTFVATAGSGGNIKTPFLNPGAEGLSLSNGQTFYYNILPFVSLDMPITNSATVSVPASITASYNIVDVISGSKTWPLGDLYDLNTGDETFDFDAMFYGGEFYSVPLIYSTCAPNALACFENFDTPNTGGPWLTTPLGGPDSGGPCGSVLIGCDLNVPSGSGSTGGYGVPNQGPLFPPGGCDPATMECANTVNVTNTTPEPGEIPLLAVGLVGLVVFSRRRVGCA